MKHIFSNFESKFLVIGNDTHKLECIQAIIEPFETYNEQTKLQQFTFKVWNNQIYFVYSYPTKKECQMQYNKAWNAWVGSALKPEKRGELLCLKTKKS